MTDSTSSLLSRRRWLGLISPAVAATTLGAGLLPPATAADPVGAPASTLGARVYNIRDFGARGDGKSLDTSAVQSAIDRCHREQGGTVLVPAGVFVIGTVEMKSNVTLHIAAGGTLLGSGDGQQYHAADAIPLEGDTTLNDGNVGLIFAVNAVNVTIEGPGTIDGQGALFRHGPHHAPPPSGRGGPHRPHTLLFYRCTNLSVRNIFLSRSAFHCVRIMQSHFVWLTGIHIHSRVNNNNDGFHFVSCQYVHISDCDVLSQDDACALFGSCQFITVTNCSFSTRWSVFRFGGGHVNNITVSNCLLHEVYGCPIKIRCGPGSVFENMSFSNLVLDRVTGPISIGVGAQPPRRNHAGAAHSHPQPTMPAVLRNVSFNGIYGTVTVPVQIADVEFPNAYRPGELRSCIVLNGTGEGTLEKVSFNDIRITFPGGGTAAEGARRQIPHFAGEYFELGVLPAWAIYARNARGVSLSNVRFETATPDLRPAVIFDHVQDAAINGLSVAGNPQAESVLRFIDTQDTLMTATRLLSPAAVFLQAEGAENQSITIDGGDLSKAAQRLAFKDGAASTAVKLREA